MGNCMVGGGDHGKVRIMMSSGGIMETEGSALVRSVTCDFPGYGIFKRGSTTLPLMDHEQLRSGQLYYLLPIDRKHMESNEELDVGLSAGCGRQSNLEVNTTLGPALEVLPSPGNGMWRVKLVIGTDQLAEILSEQVNTQALIEQMRAAASSSEATRKQGKGDRSARWRPAIPSLCKMPY